MKKPINDWWYSGFTIVILILVSLICCENIGFKAILAFVSGLFGLLRHVLLRFNLIIITKPVKYNKQYNLDLFISITLFICAFIWFIDPHSDIGWLLFIFSLLTKMYFENK